MNSHYTNNNNNINNNNNNNNIGGIPDKQSSNSAAARKDGKEEARFDAVFCRRLARILWLCVTRTISPNTRQAAAPPPKKRKGKKLLEASNSSFSSSLSFLISYIPLLYLLLLLSSGLTEVLVWFNGLSISEFYLCLNTRDYPAFQSLVIKVTVIYIAISISKALLHYFGGLFSVATRTRLTIHLHNGYVACGSKTSIFYSILHSSKHYVDNPDQRITQDVERFSETIRDILEQLVISPILIAYYTYQTAAANAGSFLGPGLIYGFFLISCLVCKLAMNPLVPLIYAREKMEGDFRFQHVRVRENSEAIAMLHGEHAEKWQLNGSLFRLVGLQIRILAKSMLLKVLTEFFNYFGAVLSYIVIAIPIFTGLMNDKPGPELSAIISKNVFESMYLIYRFTMITNLSEQFSALCGYTARIGYLLEVIDRIQADNLVDMAGNGVKGKWGSGNGTGGGNGDETDDSNYGSLHSSNSSREDSTDNLFRRATESTSVPLTTAEELGARTSVSAASTTATVNSPEHIIKLHHHPHRHQHSIAEDSNIAHNNHSHPPMQDDNDNGDKDDTIVINGLTLHIPPSSLSSPHSKESNTYSLLPPLISNLSLTLSPGTNLLISGANGSGKSSLLRSLAGLVSPTLGSTRVPPFPRSMFIPQSVYVPAHGSLMDVVGYGCCCSCLELESQDSSSSSPVPPTSPPNKSTPTTSNNNSNNRLLWHQLYLPPRPPMFWNRHQKSRASQGQCQHSNYCPTLANCVGLRTFTDDQVINCLLQKVELGYLLSRIDKQIFSTQGGDQLECVDDEVFVAAAGASNSDSSSTSPPSLSISISSHHEILYHQFDLTRLSPGELQRLHIARLLLWRPTWAFIDEGFSSIDVKGRRVLLDAVIQSGISVIMVTHGDTEERGVSTAGSSSNSIVWRQLSLERGSEGSLNNNSGNGSFKIIDLTTAQY